MAYYNASMWVGASALVRRAVLDDIVREETERGHPVKVYIDNRILIEDAAATIDLLGKAWFVYHDPARLSYSATPADFGALIIQRRRWANGGLLILPRFLGYVFRRPWSLGKFRDAMLRTPNLISASLNGVGVPILLFYRFDDDLVPLYILLAALPYYVLYASDLVMAGYRWTDFPRVYALGLLLIPVNLAGTIQSLRQACTGRPVPFRRTPKIAGRTSTPLCYLMLSYGLCAYALFCAVSDAVLGKYRHMGFSLFTGLVASYGVAVFIGWRATQEDVRAALGRINWPRGRWLRPVRQEAD
jgi:cellulose synthase (UDP-forming)